MKECNHMKTILALTFFSLFAFAESADLYKIKLNDISGKEVKLSQYKGQVMVVVNTASQCGYTPQLKGLETIYKKYKSQGLVVMAFPSNDFKQDPDDNSGILSYAQKNYQVSFPFFEKNAVTGPQKQPLYAYLTKNQKAALFKEVNWNFEKFIVGRNGEVIERLSSSVSPDSDQFIKLIEKALAQK